VANGCSWTATSSATWISLTTGASGSGSGTVSFSVAANSGTSPRTGTLTVAAQTVTVTQSSAGRLVAAYGFNAGSGKVAADVSGNGNTGAISGARWTTGGRFGQALSFDGVNDWVTVADASSLDLTTGMTLEAWIRPTKLGGWRTVLLKESIGGLAYALYADNAASRPVGQAAIGGVDRTAVGTSAIPLNTWTHVAVTYSGTTLRFFVNGTEVNSLGVTGSIVTTSSPLRFGGNAVWGEWFAGQLDEIRIYNGPLSQTEIQSDMNTPVGGG
jgi:hypothetical protein